MKVLVNRKEKESHEEAVQRLYPEEYRLWGQELKPLATIEHVLQKKYRYETMSKFMKALKIYDLIQPGDKIAVAISGGKDSLLLSKLFQSLEKFSRIPFQVKFLAMDPGYNQQNRRLLEFNCAWLDIPVEIYSSDIFAIANEADKNPCYLCARMRRGFLYDRAKELGCNKMALGHHFNDVIETTLLNVLWSANYKVMMPKIISKNFENMELIRPLYFIKEKDIIAWRDYSGLKALDCACTVTQRQEGSQRTQIKQWIEDLKKTNPNVEYSIFRSGENVALDAILGYTKKGEKHSFLEHYGEEEWTL